MEDTENSKKQAKKPKGKKLHEGIMHSHKRIRARFEADTREDYEWAKKVIEAGFRSREEADSWGMNPDDAWQLACFPMKHEDWTKRMEHLLASKLGDRSSDTFDLFHSCTWLIEPMWNWLHEIALRAENPNYKNDAGRILGKLYRQARQDKSEDRLSSANIEFKRSVNPHPWAKKKPSPALVRWVECEMMQQIEYWKRAVEVASHFDSKRFFSRDDLINGIHYYTPLPMRSIKEAWQSYFIQERNAYPKRAGSWSDFLDELESHPFCTRAPTLKQLLDIKALWKSAFCDVLKKSWENDAAIRQKCGPSFAKKFGDAKHPVDAGYRLAAEFFKRAYLLHWSESQRLEKLLNESMQRRRDKRKTVVREATTGIPDSASQEKSSPG